MAKRALITGITGQDGSFLAELLLAKGYEVVVVVSISSQAAPEAFRRPLEREVLALRHSGGRVEIVRPDAESIEAFGPNLMDFRRCPAAAANGIRQGRASLDTLRDLWG